MEALELADWRRRVAELYAEVRAMAAGDPEAAWDRWRAVRERLFREHPASPLGPAGRDRFRALHWPYDPALRFELPVAAPSDRPDAGGAVPWSRPGGTAPVRAGRITLPVAGGPFEVSLLRFPDYSGGLFLPIRDATNGQETYAGGRYVLDTAKGADLGGAGDRLVVDLNFAYQPSCAFDPRWACPLAPAENVLPVPIRAGERLVSAA